MLVKVIGEDMTLKVIPEKDVWTIKIDPIQLDQIIVNLASNSRDAISGAGHIEIETSNIVADEKISRNEIDAPPGEYVMLRFSDDGKGMDKETMEKIFEPFFTTKPKGQGTGLGLSTVYGIVKQNGGSIRVLSEESRGATFRIFFPRYYGDPDQPKSETGISDFSGTETILVVEDQPELLELARRGLAEYGYKVLIASTPEEAVLLSMAYQSEIDLLVTDVVMPNMNGRVLRDKVQSVRPAIKTVFISGYTADVIARRGVMEENVILLQKPFTPEDLARRIREVLNS
ncbi:MAG: ATP-binding protein [Bacteroidetes bacterium]|nr:ATP-binding protein [Bacteroidota bacterium]